MTKNIGMIISVVACHVFLVALTSTTLVSAREPAVRGNYYEQVPHIVLPETIQYRPYQNVSPHLNTGASAVGRPATYTAFPSYEFDQSVEFRTIQQVTYPVTPVSPSYASAEAAAEVWNNRQIVPIQKTTQKSSAPSVLLDEKQSLPTNTLQQSNSVTGNSTSNPVEPKFTIPKFDASMTSAMGQVDQNKQVIRQVAGKQQVLRKLKPTRTDDQESAQKTAMATPAGSIAFVKRDKASASVSADTTSTDVPAPLRAGQSSYASNDSSGDVLAHTFENGVYGHRSGMFGDDNNGWYDRESLFMKQASYTQLAPPTQNGFMANGFSATGNSSYQPSPLMPGYSQNYGNNFCNNMPQQQSGGLFPVKGPGAYSTAGGLNDAWNSYFSAVASQQGAGGPSPRYQSLTQLGGMMPVMAGNGLASANMNAGMNQQGIMMVPPMPMMSPMMPTMPGMQQQTIGYIVLYPQSANAGVKMQLQHGSDGNAGGNANADNGVNSGENEYGQNGEAAQTLGNNQQIPMQAVFIPAVPQQPVGIPDQYGMMNPGMNPMMTGMSGMGMMNPYMMNPYMMNPMMSGMGMMNPWMNPMMTGMGGMGMMNPYMMNPYMMNPYMMNPMMSGMGMGMMPPIIIQMPGDSAPRRPGLFARLRAARAESQKRQQESTAVMGSTLFNNQERMPAKAAYPYGFFGASGAAPFQTGNFGGYHDMYFSKTTYPGM
ncbi:MAG: hypothetical protein FWC50_01125 [Planctomycetaceae bacterium]|nr:hypothetical protein [Planctomycetaceae bacterium]